MDINERIESEEKRHMVRINELSEILKMYKNDARDYLVSTEGKVNQAINYNINPDKIVSYEESRQNINPYEKQIKETEEAIRKENELYEKNMLELNNQKNENEKKQEMLDNISLQLDEELQQLYNEEDLQDILEADRHFIENIETKINQGLELTVFDLENLYNINDVDMNSLTREGFDIYREIAERKQKIRKERNCISDLNRLFDTVWKEIPKDCTLRLDYLRNVEGLKLPEKIDGNLELNGLTTARGLVLPEKIGGDIVLNSLTSARDLVLPLNIGGHLYIERIEDEYIDLPESYKNNLVSTKAKHNYMSNEEYESRDINQQINKVRVRISEKRKKVNQVINSMNLEDLQYAPLPDIKKHLTEKPDDELNDMLSDYEGSMEEEQKEETYNGPEQDKPKVLVYKRDDNKTGGFGNVLIFSLIAAIGIIVGLIVLIISK